MAPSTDIYYRHVTTCSTSGSTSYSNVISRDSYVTVTSGGDVTQCGSGFADFTATTTGGTIMVFDCYRKYGYWCNREVPTRQQYINYQDTLVPQNVLTHATAVTVTVNPTPNVSAGSDVGICTGSTGDLNGSTDGGGVSLGTNHCASSGNTTYATSITNFTFDGDVDINNSTGQTAGYEDYTSIIAETTPGATCSK